MGLTTVTMTQLYFIYKIPDHQLLLSLAISTAVQKELDLTQPSFQPHLQTMC